MESKENHRGDQREMLMEANNLSYKFDDILNVSVNRTMKKQYFDTRTYTLPGSGQAVSTWNSGVDLIDLRNSYLKFTVTLAGGSASFGSGSAMNLIKSIKILSSSGIELSRTEDANVYHKFMSRSTHTTDWFQSVGQLMGFLQPNNFMTSAPGDSFTFVIPLIELDPFFNLYDNKLLPANVASGCRIEIAWEDMNTALLSTAGGITSYTISNIEFRTESVTLADSAMAILNRESASNGLELTYDRVYTSPANTGTNLEENLEVRKAVSIAKGVICVCLPLANLNNQQLDSFLTAETDYDFSSFDIRLGNNMYPAQPIDTISEAYFNYLKQFGKLKTHGNDTFTNYIEYNRGSTIICASFENDDSLNLTGIPVNSSRIAEIRFRRASATPIKTIAFLTYTALCRASLSNVSCKI